MTVLAELQDSLAAHGFAVEVKVEDQERDGKHFWVLGISRGGMKGGLYLNHEISVSSVPLIVSGYDSRYPE